MKYLIFGRIIFTFMPLKKSTLKTGPQDIFPASFSGKPHGIVSGLVFTRIQEYRKK
jgi:hypothetical protein